jgi:hypothetical protein
MISGGVRVLNAGLPTVVEGVPAADVVQLDWRPPAFGDAHVAQVGVSLDDEVTHEANRRAIAAVHAVRPQLVAVRPAGEVIAGMGEGKVLLHAGPPIEFERMCGPMVGALIGATLFEGWAATPAEAKQVLGSGQVEISPCHSYGAVGPMAGVISPSMPVLVVEDGDRRAFAPLIEGPGKVLVFGAFDEEVVIRLGWMRDTLGPVLDAVLKAYGPIDITSLFGQALMMGDEGHNRHIAASSLLIRRLAPTFAVVPGGVEVLDFLSGIDLFALTISMAGAKLSMDAAVGIENSTVVTAMARNGVEFGLRVAGTGEQWFTAPVGPADGLFFPGFSIEDANPDLGDSAITETLGLGGFAMAAAPAIVQFVGGTPDDAVAMTRSMQRITLGPHPAFMLPPLNFTGTPSGIDVLKVLDTGVLPVINTGIAHREAGVGEIGAGVTTAPKEVFLKAAVGLRQARDAQ